jgi:3-oxoacyl-(acyl-carrier-protein) synthase III
VKGAAKTMMTPSVRFIGVASFLPEQVISNSHFADADTNASLPDDVFFKGVRERRWATEAETSVAMGTNAAKKVLIQTNTRPQDVDLIISSALVDDLILPHVACGIQHELEAGNATAITLDTACASFVSSVIYGSALIRAGFFRTIIVVSISNFAGRAQGKLKNRAALIPGDGAAALLIKAGTDGDDGLLGWWEKSYGQYHGMFAIHAHSKCGERTRFWDPHEYVAFSFDKDLLEKIKANSLELVPLALKNAIKSAGTSIEAIDLVLTHQPNQFLIDSWRQAVGARPAQCHDTLEVYGNLFQASIPVTLADAVCKQKLKKGDKIAMASFGLAGEIVSGAVIQWS